MFTYIDSTLKKTCFWGHQSETWSSNISSNSTHQKLLNKRYWTFASSIQERTLALKSAHLRTDPSVTAELAVIENFKNAHANGF